jgi:hypothetical protein
VLPVMEKKKKIKKIKGWDGYGYGMGMGMGWG